MQQQLSGADQDDLMMAADERAAAESAAFMTAAASQYPANVRVQRVARLRDKKWQLTVLQGTKAAGMNEQQLGETLSAANDEQQRKRMLHSLMQQVKGPQSSGLRGGTAGPKFLVWGACSSRQPRV